MPNLSSFKRKEKKKKGGEGEGEGEGERRKEKECDKEKDTHLCTYRSHTHLIHLCQLPLRTSKETFEMWEDAREGGFVVCV